MSTSTRARLPVSSTNAVLLGVIVVGAVVTAIFGSWAEAILLTAVAVAVLAAALYARRPDSRDITRVNAIEYRDERDRRIAQLGFAAVGAAALVLSAIEFVVVTALAETGDAPEALRLVATGQLLVLAIVWGVANSLAARRS